jgi:hypothetical protein
LCIEDIAKDGASGWPEGKKGGGGKKRLFNIQVCISNNLGGCSYFYIVTARNTI